MRLRLASIAVGLIAAIACFMPSAAHAAPLWVKGGCSTIKVVQSGLYLQETGSGHTSTVTTGSSGTTFCAWTLQVAANFADTEIRDESNNCLSANTGQIIDNYPTVSIQGSSACINDDYAYDVWDVTAVGVGVFQFKMNYQDLGCMYDNNVGLITSCSTVLSDKYQQFTGPF